MKRSGKLLILLLVLLVAVGAYALIARLSPDEDDSAETEDETVIASQADSTGILALSWTKTNEDGERETFSFSRATATSNWTWDEDSAFPLRQSAIASMLDAICSIEASRTLSDVTDTAEYSLDDGQDPLTVTYTLSDGTQTTLRFGTTSAVSGDRYMSVSGDEGHVYLVSTDVAANFDGTLLDLVQTESVADPSEFDTVTLERNGDDLTLSYLADAGLDYSSEYVWFTEDTDGSISGTEGGILTLDPDTVTTMVGGITDIDWESVVCWNASALSDETGTMLQRCSLDADTEGAGPLVTAVIAGYDENGSEVGTTLFFGCDADETGETCYARLAGSDIIYTVDASVRDTLLAIHAADLLDDRALRMDWDTVSSVDFTEGGAEFTVERSLVEVTGDSGTVTDSYYTWEPEESNDALESFFDLFTALTGTPVIVSDYAEAPETGETGTQSDAEPAQQGEAEAEEAETEAEETSAVLSPAGDPELSLTIHCSGTYPTVTLDFYRMDDGSYVLQRFGRSVLTLTQEDVENIELTLAGLDI